MAHIVIGTRGNPLALQQADWIKQKLEQAHPGALVGLEILQPASHDIAAWQHEADLALLARRVDAVLYHLSELPARLPDECHLAVITERTEARDALLVRPDFGITISTLAELPPQMRIVAPGGHRRVQLAARQPQLRLVESEDSLETNLAKLAAGAFDALVTDAFSLTLLKAQARITLWLPVDEFLPAAGQGAFALQSRLADQRTNMMLESLNHAPTRYATSAERALLRNLYAEIGDAITAHATYSLVSATETGPQLSLDGLIGDDSLPGPAQVIRSHTSGEPSMGEWLGSTLAAQLLNAGARPLLQRAKTSQALSQTVAALNELFPNAYEFNSDFDQPVPSAYFRPNVASVAHQEAALAQVPVSANSPVTMRSFGLPVFGGEMANEFDLVASNVRKLRDQQPLHDQHILLARGYRQSPELAQKLESLGAQVIPCPTVRTAEPESWDALDKVLVHLSWYDWLAFANPQSVESFILRLNALGHRRQEIESHRLCAINRTTAASLRTHGLQADLVLPHFAAEPLVDAWEKQDGKREELRGKTMLLMTAQTFATDFTNTTRHPLRAGFDKLGLYVETAEAYRFAIQTSPAWDLFNRDLSATPDYAIFQQSASLDQLATAIEPRSLNTYFEHTRIVCMTESAREAVRAAGLTMHQRANETNLRALVKWMREDCQQRRDA